MFPSENNQFTVHPSFRSNHNPVNNHNQFDINYPLNPPSAAPLSDPRLAQSPVWQSLQPQGFGPTRPQPRGISGLLPAISEKNLQRIRRGEFINFEILLDTSFQDPEGKLELKNEQGSISIVQKQRGKEIKNISEWLQAWSIFLQTYSYFYPSQIPSLLVYQDFIIRAASQYNFARVKSYDKHFRMRLSINPSASWEVMDEQLFNQILRGSSGPSSYACYACGENSHSYSDCPKKSDKKSDSSSQKIRSPTLTPRE